MLYYNYSGVKKQTQDKGAQVVEKYRKQFQKNMEMYNYTAKGKQQMIADLVGQMENELAQLKNGFMEQSKSGVYGNKQTLLEERQSTAPKTEQAKTNQLLEFFKNVQLYEAHIGLYGVDMELLQQLAQDETVSSDLFQIVKAKMVAVETDETNKANIRGIKKVDLKMNKIDSDIKDYEVLASQINSPILPVALDGKDSYELITGEPISDYYWNNNTEVND